MLQAIKAALVAQALLILARQALDLDEIRVELDNGPHLAASLIFLHRQLAVGVRQEHV